MEVHPPHQSVHTWRDFVIHLVIVTIGLFIALSLESFVEYLHHRHIVHEARENIRQEIEDNHKAALHDLDIVQKNIDTQKANIQAIHALSKHPKNFHGSVTNSWSFDMFHDAAWRTARDSGALTYMPYDEVQRYSDLYGLEEFVNNHATSAAERTFLAGSFFEMGFNPENMPDGEYMNALHDNAAVEIQLITLKQFVHAFDKQCETELKR